MKETELPSDYQPFERLILGGNVLENVYIPFVLSGNVPLLIGCGVVPQIWLDQPMLVPPQQAPVGWVPVIRANTSPHGKISITHPSPNQTIVRAEEILIIDCITEAPNQAKVVTLDLRPIGLRIHADEKQLTFVNQTFAGNRFSNLRVMIALTSPKTAPVSA